QQTLRPFRACGEVMSSEASSSIARREHMNAQGNSRPALTLRSFYHGQPPEESFFIFLPEDMKSLTNTTVFAPKERNNSHFFMTRVHDVYYAINFSQLVSLARDG